MTKRARTDIHRAADRRRRRRVDRSADLHAGTGVDRPVSHPFARIVGLSIVLCATPVIRFVACFSVTLALALSGVVEVIRGWSLIPDPPEIPTRDLRWVAPRCEP